MIRAVLFDADGVLQYPPPQWTALVEAAAPGFFARLLEHEAPFLRGEQTDWLPALRRLLAEEPGGLTEEAFLAAWLGFRPDPHALDVVREVRTAGVRTLLGTNQQLHRDRFMQAERFYDDVMDAQYVSHRLGVTKPDCRFFERVLATEGLAPAEVLFVDDSLRNVRGALDVGLRARHKPEDEGPDRLRAILLEEGVLAGLAH